jgi:mono/diheme cytochrome c family protein
MGMSDGMMATGLMMPQMDAANGRQLFASKGCVVCHAVNGIGGQDAPPLDAENMDLPMNPFDFAANMWRGAETMVILQREELGDVIQISGQELADIIVFVHDPKEQAQFTGSEIPSDVKKMMEHHETEAEGAHD